MNGPSEFKQLNKEPAKTVDWRPSRILRLPIWSKYHKQTERKRNDATAARTQCLAARSEEKKEETKCEQKSEGAPPNAEEINEDLRKIASKITQAGLYTTLAGLVVWAMASNPIGMVVTGIGTLTIAFGLGMQFAARP